MALMDDDSEEIEKFYQEQLDKELGRDVECPNCKMWMEPEWLGGHNCNPGLAADLEDVADQLRGFSYRVMRGKDVHGEFLAIYEVYYNKDGSIATRTEEPIGDTYTMLYPEVYGEDALSVAQDELREHLRYMLKALEDPILEEEDFGGPPTT